jgi:hypothetical protein
VSCQNKTAGGKSGSHEAFNFAIKPNAKQEVWRYVGTPCTLTVTVTGAGTLNLALRGY